MTEQLKGMSYRAENGSVQTLGGGIQEGLETGGFPEPVHAY